MNVPSVSLHRGGTPPFQDVVVGEQGPTSRRGVSHALVPEGHNGVLAVASTARSSLSSSDVQSAGDDGQQGEGKSAIVKGKADATAILTDTLSCGPEPCRLGLVPPMGIPSLSRTLTEAPASQLTQLQNPHRRGALNSDASPRSASTLPAGQTSQFREISVELADSIQTVVQTMLQISPPQVLDPAKEHYSACGLFIPTSSMSAIFTAMKNLNYISAHLAAFCSEVPRIKRYGDIHVYDRFPEPAPSNEFDLGELLQCVGDALSGAAAQVGADIVLYHSDARLKHPTVWGDESTILFVLSHIVRRVLYTAGRGDAVSLGLFIAIPGSSPSESSFISPGFQPGLSSSNASGSLECKIRISHTFGPQDSTQPGREVDADNSRGRMKPQFSRVLLHRILGQVRGALTAGRSSDIDSVRTWDLNLILERRPLSSAQLGDPTVGETTLDRLLSFGEKLKGKKLILHANPSGPFGQHLTDYLTVWDMEVKCVSPDGKMSSTRETPPDLVSHDDAKMASALPLLGSLSSASGGDVTPISTFIAEMRQEDLEPASLIMIDDDMDVLKERLDAYREAQNLQPVSTRQRPSLAPHHRPRSSPQIARLIAHMSNLRRTPVAIVHFTCLANYKMIKDLMQTAAAQYAATSTPLPEVMIVLKPAGPRRILTILHTAITKPVVDPFFAPIATSPKSPGRQPEGFYFKSPPVRTTPPTQSSGRARPNGSLPDPDRSVKSATKNGAADLLISAASPLGISDNAEYFSEAAVKLGTSPSSGLVIQSPDGQPTGIFFHPRVKGPRHISNQYVERDTNQLPIPLSRKSTSTHLASSEMGEGVSLSCLPGVSFSVPNVLTSQEASNRRPSTSTTPSGLGRMASRKTSPFGKRPNERSTGVSFNRMGKTSADGNIVPPISVLVVDDNPINQNILSTFMKRKKIKYDVASNGQEAVEKWRTGGFHLILMDIQMPLMNGIQATKEIRRLEKSNAMAGYPPLASADDMPTSPSSVPSPASTDGRSSSSPYHSSVIIVALTASSLQSDRVAALAAGCNDFLTKPVDLVWLNNKIIEWGSIKALQMWADQRPEVVPNMSSGQAAQARIVADRLHLPMARGTPSPSRRASLVLGAPPAVIGVSASEGAPQNSSNMPPGTISSTTLANANALVSSGSPTVHWPPGQQASPGTVLGPFTLPSSSRGLTVQGGSVLSAISNNDLLASQSGLVIMRRASEPIERSRGNDVPFTKPQSLPIAEARRMNAKRMVESNDGITSGTTSMPKHP